MEESSSVRDILVSIGYKPKETGGRYACTPLYRDSNNAGVLSVDKKTGLWYDFKEGTGGRLHNLIAITLNIKPEEAFLKLKDKNFVENKEEEGEQIFQLRQWPSECLAKLMQDHRHWEAKDVPERIVKQFRGGIAKDGRMSFRYVFPIFNDREQIIGFSGRDLIKNSIRVKWKILGPKKHFCYPYFLNHEQLHYEKEVILVESIGDMLSLMSNGVTNVLVTFGLNLHTEVLKTLLKVNPERIVISLNRDENFAGQGAAFKMREELKTFFGDHKIKILYPESEDFGDMNLEQYQIWKEKLKSFQPQG